MGGHTMFTDFFLTLLAASIFGGMAVALSCTWGTGLCAFGAIFFALYHLGILNCHIVDAIKEK